MDSHFASALPSARGRSEFVIVVVADIRGFSRFSTRNESPNIAMYIKRFYHSLMTDYFPKASFVKPTGDGLLMTFTYDETSLTEVSKEVIEACLRCLAGFPTICKDDPMINFDVPNAIGFGISRGTACCLYSGDETLDYSGHLLNLASRLNDLARPSGIVIDGDFMEATIPESARALFKTQLVYVRSIAEEQPIPVFFLEPSVKIPDSALVPLADEQWRVVFQKFIHSRMLKLSERFAVGLPVAAKASDRILVTLQAPKRGVRNIMNYFVIKDFEYAEEGTQAKVYLNLKSAGVRLGHAKTVAAAEVAFKIEYVPKPLPRP